LAALGVVTERELDDEPDEDREREKPDDGRRSQRPI
jgi:hypothetical protein